MEDDYGSNVHAGLEKSVRFIECPLWRGFLRNKAKGFFRNSSGRKFLSVLER